jgi:hypothetical protein
VNNCMNNCMRDLLTLIVCIAGALMTMHSAHASYTGLQVVREQVTLQDGTLMNRFRVYAVCSNPDDAITAVSGQPAHLLLVQSRTFDDTAPGSAFYNAFGGGASAPTLAAIANNADVEHDTFVSIGVATADQGSGSGTQIDETTLSPGFSGIPTVASFSLSNLLWLGNPAVGPSNGVMTQARAGYLGDGDPQLRVLLMQLTVSSTSTVRGTVMVSGWNGDSGAAFTLYDQTFNSIPGPPILSVILIGGVIPTHRRSKPRTEAL